MKAIVVGVVAALVTLLAASVDPAPAQAAPAGDDEVVAFVVHGVGNGHGRGMSQWGAYGRAVAGQTWQQILAAYYGGTTQGTRSFPNLRVRLTGWDGAAMLGVVSRTGTARWHGSTTGYGSLYAVETAPNVFSVYGVTSGLACPGALDLTIPFEDLAQGDRGQAVARMQSFLNHFGFDAGPVDGIFGPMTAGAVRRFQLDEGLADDGRWRATVEAVAAQARVDAEPGSVGWQRLASGVPGPIRFTTTVDESSAAPGDVLGICDAGGVVRHYRGAVELLDVAGTNRVVNELDVENYLRGVVPREVPASWGDAGGGTGMHALRAQAVAARSYGLAQNRYSYARTCDTTACQVYAGAATRLAPTLAAYESVEHALTDRAIVDTAGVVRVKSGAVVSTEFSASNGPRTAGGAFPAVDDPWDDVGGNPNHRWTRIIDADTIRSRYGLASANGVATVVDADSPYDGIWANEVRLGDGRTVSAWDFRNAFGLPAPGFELEPIRRTLSAAIGVAFIGDSVGASVAGTPAGGLRVLTEGMFSAASWDVVSGRRTQGGSGVDGVGAAAAVPVGTDLVVVELGYNDDPAAMPGRIDAAMSALRNRGVARVAWLTVSERRSTFAVTNAAIRAAATRWPELVVLDWEAASDHAAANRWYSDGVHLTATGQAEFARWLRDRIVDLADDGYVPPQPPRAPGRLRAGEVLRVPVVGRFGVPVSGASGVALNVTAVRPDGQGYLRAWPCGSVEPATSSVNFRAGGVEPNAVVVPVDATGEVCVSSLWGTDVVVDVTAWFESGVRAASGRLFDSRPA